MTDSAGIRNDWAREKNANPMMYAATRTANNHGDVNGRVTLIILVSIGAMICLPARWMSISSRGAGAKV